jgi:DNA-binding MarR family transcriptional regulator
MDTPTLSTPWLLRRVNQRYRSAISAALHEAGHGDLPQPGYWALAALGSGTADAGDLVALMGISKQGVSKLVDLMVGGGFVERQVNQADRRRTNLVRTRRGHDAAGVIATTVAATDAALAALLGLNDLTALRRLLIPLLAPQ